MSSIKYAREVAQRSTCPTNRAGAVLVTTTQEVIVGYTGAPKKQPHCDLFGCTIDDTTQRCTQAMPAELNAIVYAARKGISTNGATLYLSSSPDPSAIGAVINAGVARVVAPEVAQALHPILRESDIEIDSEG